MEPAPEPSADGTGDDNAPLRFDLNARRAARAAETDHGPVVVLGYVLDDDGNETDVPMEWELPPRLPLAVINNVGALMQGNPLAIGRVLRDLFGDEAIGVPEDPETGDGAIEGHPVFAELDMDDFQELFELVIAPAYGISLGNSQASNRASRRAGQRSRPTSSATTR